MPSPPPAEAQRTNREGREGIGARTAISGHPPEMPRSPDSRSVLSVHFTGLPLPDAATAVLKATTACPPARGRALRHRLFTRADLDQLLADAEATAQTR